VSLPCQHGGTCTLAPDRFLCECAIGYTGDRCQTEINECDSSPCLNGGTCHDDVGFYQCQCAEPYFGDNCEKCKEQFKIKILKIVLVFEIYDVVSCSCSKRAKVGNVEKIKCSLFCNIAFGQN